MNRLQFGAFLAPHHPVGEHPRLQLQRDLHFVEHLDRLGFDEFWCGEHHSSGWEMIASPEMFLAAAAERTARIKLATGVISLPYHNPYMVAQRMVQLDWQSGGRAIFGSGPGALASDAHTLGIDPMLLRDRQDEAIQVIRRLFKGERITQRSEWFNLNDAALQLLPMQEEMPFAVASQISPSGMTLAGKHGIGLLSIGATLQAGADVLAMENVEELFPLPEDFTGDGDLFMLRVRGTSMIEVGIMDGDFVVARRQETANNGDIVNEILRVEHGHEKEYLVTVERPVTDTFLSMMAAGVRIGAEKTKPARVTRVDANRFRIVLTQGLNRQIRRMCSALGWRVKHLVRLRIMHIKLGDLPSGRWRDLTEAELKALLAILAHAKRR